MSDMRPLAVRAYGEPGLMAGSKKGERRGGRKAGVEPKPHAPKTAVKKETPRDKHYDRQRGTPKRTEEYYREITRAMDPVAAKEIEPRDVMLDAMRWFHDKTVTDRQMLKQIVEQLPMVPESSPQWPAINDMLSATESRIERNLVLSTDMAFKVAPYVHAKLASIEMSGPDKRPIEIIQTLLVEIAEINKDRPSWMQESTQTIEHIPQVGEET
jgi:hypothetical protein